MPGFLVRGALIEYGSDFMGPIPNVVIFQFNPESLSRTVEIARRTTSATSRELTQAGEPSVEKISLKASFSAADEFGENKALARLFGVGTRLAALEKMVYPASKLTAKIGAALSSGAPIPPPPGAKSQPMPRHKMPRILFIWGPYKILPVVLESMSIVEQQYDFVLNPVQAEVSISMAVNSVDRYTDDPIGKGALTYSNMAKDAQAMANLANTAEQAVELIPF
jgi:hypothetical protein